MLKDDFKAISSNFEGSIEYEGLLSKQTFYQIGGPADAVVTPKTLGALKKVHKVIRENNVPFLIIGWGSNILIPDTGFRGVVIRMKHLFCGVEEVDSETLKLGASVGASSLLRIAAVKGYGGLARLTGIPGSVGGMVVMNAGTHLGEIGPLLIKTDYVDFASKGELEIQTRIHKPTDFSYRTNHFLKPSQIILHTYMRFQKTDPIIVKTEIDALYQRRKLTQPVDQPSCGSVFMNPTQHGLQAWQVIEKLGLRGHQIGNAQISEKHANFIVNLGGAKSSDVKALIDLVKSRAKAELNIEMQEEVKIIP